MASSSPWRDEDTLQELYHGEKMTHQQIADKLGCTQPTVTKWCNKHDIEPRGVSNTPASFYTTERGYEFWSSTVPSEGENQRQEYVRVHRLLAVAKYGFEEVIDSAVHHKKPIPWLNTYDNIDLMTHEEHGRHHAEEADVQRDEQGRWS
jgi:hypothetical protein